MKFVLPAAFLGVALTAVMAGGVEPEGSPAPEAAKSAETAKAADAVKAPEPPVPGGGEGVAAVPGASLRDSDACIADPGAVDELKRRREQLEARQKELDTREAEIKARERALEEEIAKISAVRDEIGKVDEARKKENDERVAKLVETVETMSPKAGSTLLASLDEPLAVAVIAKLATPKLAKIMNLMEPRKSARLSELLTGAVGTTKVKGTATSAVQPAPASKATYQVAATEKEAEKPKGLLASSLDIPLSTPKESGARADEAHVTAAKKGGEKYDDGKSEQ